MTRWRWPVAVLAGAIVVASGGYAVARTRGSDVSYRTATASIGDVERTLDLSGTITAAGRRDLSFGAAGSVAKVVVGAGQQVRSGQVLARLDPTSFDAAVTSAVATLARAEAQLASDEDAQAAAVTAVTASTTSTKTSAKPRSSPPSSTGSSPASPSAPAATLDPALQQLLTRLTTEQKAVTEAQSAATEALTASRAALDAQAESCRALSGSSGESPSDGSSAAPTAAPSDDGAYDGADDGADSDDGSADDPDDDPDDGGLSSACTGALATVQAAQDTVADRQDTLQSALSTLGETLGQAVTEVDKPTPATGQGTTGGAGQGTTGGAGQGTTGGAGQGTTGGAGQGTTQSPSQGGSAQPSTGTPADSSDQGRTGSVTAARLAQDQADIDTANARLVQARAEREAATLRAPYAGRILRSDLSKGDLVAASDPAFVLVGQGVTTVSTTVTTAQVPSVRRGQRVTVVPAGWTTPLTGTVSAIGLLPDSDSAFPVTVTLAPSRTVAEGTTASVSIVTGSAEDAVTVPLSALTRTGDRATVQVLAQGKVTQTQVTVGVVGARTVSITQGLGRGSDVVLADLDAAVPSSTTSGQRGGGNGLDGSRLGPASPRRAGR